MYEKLKKFMYEIERAASGGPFIDNDLYNWTQFRVFYLGLKWIKG